MSFFCATSAEEDPSDYGDEEGTKNKEGNKIEPCGILLNQIKYF